MAYSFQDLAFDVLQRSPTPLTYQEMWQSAEQSGLSKKIQTTGITPWNSLGA